MVYRIVCIVKDDRSSAYEAIKSVGTVDTTGAELRMSQSTVIQAIDLGHKFYVERGGVRANVITSISSAGHRYIKTESDGAEPNNLLSLPSCV